jgi:hypothetical protein
MEAAALVLLLSAGDPASREAATAVQQRLTTVAPQVRVLAGPEAAADLAQRGLKDADLVARSERALALTSTGRLVLLRVERRQTGEDQVVDIELWAHGRRTSASAAAGKAARDPQAEAADTAAKLVADSTAADFRDRSDTEFLARFSEKADWRGLVQAVNRLAAPSPRLRHAAAMAHLRLGDRAAAAAEIERLRAEAPDHPLVQRGEAALIDDAELGDAPALR